MTHRFYAAFVWTAWLASMGWLFVAKIWPTLNGGSPPDYSAAVANDHDQPTVWRISWNDRRIGMSASQSVSRSKGTAMRHVVQFEHLPLDTILSETFGMLGSVFRAGLGGDEPLELGMLLATELHFDSRGRLVGFQTVVDVAEQPGLLTMQGEVDDRQKLKVATRLAPFGQSAGKGLRHEIDLPPNAVLGDAFAPRPELRHLRVGQKWTIPVYRPFPPQSPVQILAAEAVRHELLLWGGEDVETILVTYQADAGSGLQATREPIAREWVREDGMVLQHELRWSGAVIRFERLPTPGLEPVVEYLKDAGHARLWPEWKLP